MIKVTILYPSDKGSKFDIDYYCKKHMPMVQQKLGAACKKIAVERGLEGGAPGSKPGFAAMGHLYCDSVEAFRAAFGPHAKEIMADIPNYTDIPPTIQISEVKVG
ncbi:MAG TPA: EthD family reductase [Xanthobacteraceae bacterium]